MIIYRITTYSTSDFASLVANPSTSDEQRCLKCNARSTTNWKELDAYWDSECDTIPDFIHSASGGVVAKRSCLDLIYGEFPDFQIGSIQYFENPIAESQSAPLRLCILPYTGPELGFMMFKDLIPIGSGSNLIVEKSCDFCGHIVYKDLLDGLEKYRQGKIIPKDPKRGLLFEGHDLAGRNIFRPRGTGLVLCTEVAKSFIANCRFTNVLFLEYGKVI